MATWSDSKAVQDYQNFLSSGKQEIELKRDQPSVIIRPREGAGDLEIAKAVHSMGMGDDIIITPDQEMPGAVGGYEEFPVYIALPPYQLEDFLTKDMPQSYKARTDDFVFFSGGHKCGNIEDALRERGKE